MQRPFRHRLVKCLHTSIVVSFSWPEHKQENTISFGWLVEGESWQLPLTDLSLLAAVAVYDVVITAVNVAATVSILRGTFAVAADVQTAVTVMDGAAAAVTGGKR